MIKAVKAGRVDARGRHGHRRRPSSSTRRRILAAPRRRRRRGEHAARRGERRRRARHRVTPELAAEGTARDLIRLVQQARRDASLARQRPHHADARRARRRSAASSSTHAQLIADATLATSLNWYGGEPNAELDGEPIDISVERASKRGPVSSPLHTGGQLRRRRRSRRLRWPQPRRPRRSPPR